MTLVLVVDDVPAHGRAVRLRPPAPGRLRRAGGAGRPAGARAARRRAGGLRDPRPRDAGHGRLRGAARARAARLRGPGDRLHRHRQLRPLHPGRAARRLRVHRQGRAGGADRAGDRAGARAAPAPRARCGRCGAGWTARRSLVGSSAAMLRLREQIARVAPVPSTVLVVGRERHGQGAGRARAPPARRAARGAVRRHQLRRAARAPGRERAVRPRARARSPAPASPGGAPSRRPSAARSSSTRSASCRSRRRPSCSACSRSAGSPGSAPPGRLPVEARVVAATNRDLEAEVRRGAVPRGPLLPASTSTRSPSRRCASGGATCPRSPSGFAAAICERFGIRPKRLAPDTLELLMGYDWSRNNVRELRNVVERMIIATDGEVIGPEQVPSEIRGETEPAAGGRRDVPGAQGGGGAADRDHGARAARVARDADRGGARAGGSREPAQDHAAAQHQAALEAGRLAAPLYDRDASARDGPTCAAPARPSVPGSR